MAARPHIVHLIGSLEPGGAELFLQRLALGIARVAPELRQSVWTISGAGPLAAALEAADIDVRPFGISKSPAGLWRVRGIVHALASSGPSLVQTWMYHADAIGLLARARGLRVPQVWTLRQSNLSASVNRPETRLLMKVCARYSKTVPAVIVAGSHAALDAHREVGYAPRRTVIIHNGVDTSRFRPDAERRAAARRFWGVDDETIVIGCLARFSPVKGHARLFAAVARLAEPGATCRPWRLVCVGQGADAGSPTFARLVASYRLDGHVIAAGHAHAPETVLPGFDIAVSSSLGEGFPNAVAEAMACGVPVVATDVGDTRELLGEAGRLVPRDDPDALGTAIGELVRCPSEARSALGGQGRRRVEHEFRESDAVQGYLSLYRSLLNGPV